MNITLWERMIDIIYFMIDFTIKYVANNTNIKIQNGVLFVTAGATFQL